MKCNLTSRNNVNRDPFCDLFSEYSMLLLVQYISYIDNNNEDDVYKLLSLEHRI